MASNFLTVTGNQVNVYINGVLLNVLTTLRCTDDYGYEPVVGFGDIHVKEYVPTVARHAVSISKFLLTLENAVTAGIILQNGDAAMLGNTFNIQIFAKGGPLIKQYTHAVNTSSDLNIQSNRLIVSDANFVATDTSGTLSST